MSSSKSEAFERGANRDSSSGDRRAVAPNGYFGPFVELLKPERPPSRWFSPSLGHKEQYGSCSQAIRLQLGVPTINGVQEGSSEHCDQVFDSDWVAQERNRAQINGASSGRLCVVRC